MVSLGIVSNATCHDNLNPTEYLVTANVDVLEGTGTKYTHQSKASFRRGGTSTVKPRDLILQIPNHNVFYLDLSVMVLFNSSPIHLGLPQILTKDDNFRPRDPNSQ